MKTIIYFCLVLFPLAASAQNNAYEKGLQLKAAYKNEEGLAVFQSLLKTDSNKVEYLGNTSYFLSKVGARKSPETKQMDYFKKAEYLAKKAIHLNPKDAESHYAYALALARLNEHASSKEKIANAKKIKSECEQTLKLNPNHAGAYHILGRWHRTIANFSFAEKLAINALFGGVPEGGSYESAIDNFEKAIQLQPTYMLHYLELAQTFVDRDNDGDKAKAKSWLEKALRIPATNEDDKSNRKRIEELYNEVK